jgi:hypothetical protein
MNCSVDYKAQEAAFQETLARVKASRRTTYPVTGQAAKQGATQTLQECVGESSISKRTKVKDRRMVGVTKQVDQ